MTQGWMGFWYRSEFPLPVCQVQHVINIQTLAKLIKLLSLCIYTQIEILSTD